MTFFFFFFLLAIFGTAGLIMSIFVHDQYSKWPQLAGGGTFLVATALAIVVAVLSSFHSVPNGNVGLVQTFGKITSQRGVGGGGLVFTMPWQTITSADVQTQSKCPDGSHPIKNSCPTGFGAFSRESNDVQVTAIINYKVSPEHIQALYRTVGPDYATKIILPRVAQILKDETVKYSTTDIAPNRETIRKAVATRLEDELGPRSITVEDFLLTNIDFPNAEIKKSIDGKVIQAQNAIAAEAQVKVSEAVARQKAAAALGEADALRNTAQGQADANRLVSQSLTPELIQFQTVQKLAANVSVMLLPSGSGNLLDVSSLIPAKK